MASGVVIALVCAALAFGLWRVLRREIRKQSSHTAPVQSTPPGAPAVAVAPRVQVEPTVQARSVAVDVAQKSAFHPDPSELTKAVAEPKAVAELSLIHI